MNPKPRVLLAWAAWTCLAGSFSVAHAGAPPTTVVTHGYQFFGTVPEWPYALANGVAVRAGVEGGEEGQVYIYEGSNPDLVVCQHGRCTASGTGHTVIVFDWASESNQSGAGFSEAAAEAFFAGLIAWSEADNPLVDLSQLHLIGHSRGAIVNSEIAERLIASGYPAPIQVTSLDPHDAGEANRPPGSAPEGGLDDYDVNQEHPEYDCHAESPTPGVCSWVGTAYHDVYWQDENGAGCFISPDGRELYGASNFNQNGLDDPFCHSDTHRWYLMTIDTDVETHPVTGLPPGPDWYGAGLQCDASPRTTPLARTRDGYNLSAAAGGESNRCPTGPNTQQQVNFDFGLQEGLVNGDFERTRDTGAQAGWSFHGGDLQGDFGFDTSNYLILESGGSARHNRFYLPAEALAMQICRKVSVASASDLLSMTLSSPTFPDRQLLSAEQQNLASPSDWECFEAQLIESETDAVVQIEVSVSNTASPSVFVDEIRPVLGIFLDGFEDGTTTAWSATVE